MNFEVMTFVQGTATQSMHRLKQAAVHSHDYVPGVNTSQALCARRRTSFHWQFKPCQKVNVLQAMAHAAPNSQLSHGHIIEASSLSAPLQSEDLIFYTHVLCPYAERVWLTLLEKQVKHILVHVDLSRKPPWYKDLNPRGLVPCVVYRNQCMIESEDICRCGALH